MREVPEWKGKTDDDHIPDRVRMRVFLRYGGRCHCCNRLILVGEEWDLDHTVALCNGGSHSESNLRPILVEHHRAKTVADVRAKSKGYRVRKRHLGIQKSKRPMIGSKASGWKKRMDGTVVKRPSQ